MPSNSARPAELAFKKAYLLHSYKISLLNYSFSSFSKSFSCLLFFRSNFDMLCCFCGDYNLHSKFKFPLRICCVLWQSENKKRKGKDNINWQIFSVFSSTRRQKKINFNIILISRTMQTAKCTTTNILIGMIRHTRTNFLITRGKKKITLIYCCKNHNLFAWTFVVRFSRSNVWFIVEGNTISVYDRCVFYIVVL